MFKKYQHIERLGTSGVRDLCNGECYIFTKLDGTNASVYLNQDGEIKAGSRNRELSLEKDNAGFFEYVLTNQNIKQFFNKYPNYRLYGEWLVKHTIKTYKEDAWRKFYIFDVIDENDKYLSYEEYLPMLQEFSLDYIPLIEKINNPTSEQILNLAKNTHFLQDEKDHAEGVVVKNYDFVNQFGRVVWGKFVLEEFNNRSGAKKQTLPTDINNAIESTIIDDFLTVSFIEKEKTKLLLEKDTEWTNKYIGEFLGRVWTEFLKEEMFNIIKKLKQPVINFRVLNKMAIDKIRKQVL